MTAKSFAAILLEMAVENETLAARYQGGLTEANAQIVQPKIDQCTKRAEALRAGAQSLGH